VIGMVGAFTDRKAEEKDEVRESEEG